MSGEYPEALEALAGQLGKLPGIGRRTAERLAMALLDWDQGELETLGGRVSRLRQEVHTCKICGNLADGERCRICLAPNRDKRAVCVVEHPRQVPVIEQCGRFRGLYHVLGGRLSPLDGIEINDLNVDSLYDRIATQHVQEVILATSPDVEGEATASYLAEELQKRFDIEISRIALGIPVGSDLSFADTATMAMAIDSRRKM